MIIPGMITHNIVLDATSGHYIQPLPEWGIGWWGLWQDDVNPSFAKKYTIKNL